MLKTRKLQVWLTAFVMVIIAYLAYNRLVDTPTIQVQPVQDDTADLDVPQLDTESAKIGEAVVGTVEKSEYIVLDEEKNVKRVFGFARLLNPDAGSEEWRLQEPYMEIYEQAVKYEIVSDRGTCRMENVAGNPSPTYAHLIDNVKIHVLPTGAGGPPGTTIYLDDLLYDSERSEFKTDGPIKIISEEGRMEGTGMLLIYNDTLGRVEYLEIKDMDYLYIKDVAAVSSSEASAGSLQASTTAEVTKVVPDMSSAESARVNAPVPRPAGSGPDQQAQAAGDFPADTKLTEGGSAPPEQGRSVQRRRDDYYECRFQRDVVITYGRQIVAEGADQVTIRNILLSGWSAKAGSAPSAPKPAHPNKTSETARVAEQSPPATHPEAVVAPVAMAKESRPPGTDSAPSDPVDEPAAQEAVDVYVTCKGGVTIQPLTSILSTTDVTTEADKTPVIELTGKSVRINQISAAQLQGVATIAKCGILKYDLDNDTVDMFTNEHEKSIFLSMARSEAQLETTGSVQWERKLQQATVTGPGKLLMPSAKERILRDETPTEMSFNGIMHVFFADHRPDEAPYALDLKSVYLVGGMAASMGDVNTSQMSAESADFFFDQAGEITRADLAGGVSFSSAKGQIDSQRAKILFAGDPAGKARPVTMQSTGGCTLTPAARRNSKHPARFGAKNIDYDMDSGNAFAAGPVKFVFYVNDPNYLDSGREPDPVVITADDSAEFFGDEDRVVFNGNVVGTRRTQTPAYLQTSTFHGQKLIVQLVQNETDSTDIQHVTVVDGKVRLESIRSVDDVTVNHVRLSCLRIDYEAGNKVVIATGPGDIQINNENAPPPDKDEADKKISLQRPCYALIKGFDKLRWFTTGNRITADGKTESVNMNYLPLVEGKRGQLISAAATHIEVNFTETASGRSELAKLRTTGGVFYREVGGNEFVGDTLFYDTAKSLMTVAGTDQVPCLLNGALADGIEYDLKTGKAKARLASKPGTLSRPKKRSRLLLR
jgi:hypothetical protein